MPARFRLSGLKEVWLHAIGKIVGAFIGIHVTVIERRQRVSSIDDLFYIPDIYLSASPFFRRNGVFATRTPIAIPRSRQWYDRISKHRVISAEVDSDKNRWPAFTMLRSHDQQ